MCTATTSTLKNENIDEARKEVNSAPRCRTLLRVQSSPSAAAVIVADLWGGWRFGGETKTGSVKMWAGVCESDICLHRVFSETKTIKPAELSVTVPPFAVHVPSPFIS